MNGDEFQSIDKLTSYNPLSKTQMNIEDHLKVHTPTSREGQPVDPTLNFQRIYLHFLNEVDGTRNAELAQPAKQGENIKGAMKEAENAYDSMMQIHEKINEAYKEFMRMQS